MDAYTKRATVKCTLLCQLLLEEMDILRDTTIYSQNLKNQVNRLSGVLENFCKDNFDTMYSEDVNGSLDLIDKAVDYIVHDAVITAETVKPYNLFVLKGKNGSVLKIKSELDFEEFQKTHNIKLFKPH
jgi:hypothetical protein